MAETIQIYDTKTKRMRDMTPEEIAIAENMPNPEDQATPEEVMEILLGGIE